MIAQSAQKCYNKDVTSVGCFYFLNKLPSFWTPCACDKVDRKQNDGNLLGETMKEIPLNNGMVAMVSDDDYEYLSQWGWRTMKYKNGKWYVYRKETVLMHRVIANSPKGMDTDHRDGNTLNNQRSNLRICTRSQNSANSRPSRKNKNGYRGVSYDKKREKYRAEIWVMGKRIRSKGFSTAKEAALAYNKLARKHFGEFATTNEEL